MTDQVGRCVVESDREMVWVHAMKGEVGESDDVPAWTGAAQRDGELRIALTPGVRLRGTVLRADGLPATGVAVRMTHAAATHEVVHVPEPTETDADGRFEFELRPGTLFEVIAEEGARSARAGVVTVAAGDKEVVLRLPGAFSLRGLVLDPAGRPLAGAGVGIWAARPADCCVRRESRRPLGRAALAGLEAPEILPIAALDAGPRVARALGCGPIEGRDGRPWMGRTAIRPCGW